MALSRRMPRQGWEKLSLFDAAVSLRRYAGGVKGVCREGFLEDDGAIATAAVRHPGFSHKPKTLIILETLIHRYAVRAARVKSLVRRRRSPRGPGFTTELKRNYFLLTRASLDLNLNVTTVSVNNQQTNSQPSIPYCRLFKIV